MHGRVKLVLVPGHVGIGGNKIADESARKVAERTPLSIQHHQGHTTTGSGVVERKCFPAAFLQMERARESLSSHGGLHGGPGSRMHQVVAGSREEAKGGACSLGTTP